MVEPVECQLELGPSRDEVNEHVSEIVRPVVRIGEQAWEVLHQVEKVGENLSINALVGQSPQFDEGRVHRSEGSSFLYARYHLTSPTR